MKIGAPDNIANLYLSTMRKSGSYFDPASAKSIANDFSSLLRTPSTNKESANTLSFVRGMKTNSGAIKSALNSLTRFDTFKGKSLQSEDESKLTVTSSKDSSAADMTVKIDQIAKGQVNEGRGLSKGGLYGSNESMKFEIEHEGKKHAFTVSASATDTNKQVQEKIADAVNSANIGVKASVTDRAKDNASILTFEAKAEGDTEAAKFKVYDISGNAISATGTANATESAQNAIYHVNGGEAKTSTTNDVTIGNGTTVKLREASDEAVTISRRMDTSKAVDKAKEFAESYNDLLSLSYHNDSDKGARRLTSQLASVTKTYSASLSRIGLGVDANGYINVDEKKLEKAANDGSLQKFFNEDSNKSFGFTNRMSRVADNVGNDPSKYVSNFNSGSSSSMDFYNSILSSGKSANNYLMGLMLDFFV